MTPEDKINKLFSHLNELQDITNELNINVQNLSIVHGNLSAPESDMHPDVVQNVTDMHSIIATKMAHTENMVSSLLDSQRIEHLTNFINLRHNIFDNLPIVPEEEDNEPMV